MTVTAAIVADGALPFPLRTNRTSSPSSRCVPCCASSLAGEFGDLGLDARGRAGVRNAWLLQERLNKEVKRRTDVVGIFPNERAIIRNRPDILAEQHDEWAVARRYFSAESLAKLTVSDSLDPLPAPALLEDAA